MCNVIFITCCEKKKKIKKNHIKMCTYNKCVYTLYEYIKIELLIIKKKKKC